MGATIAQRLFHSYGSYAGKRPAEFIVLSVLLVGLATSPLWEPSYRAKQDLPLRLWATDEGPQHKGNVWAQSIEFRGHDLLSKQSLQKIFDLQRLLEETVVVEDGKGIALKDVCARAENDTAGQNGVDVGGAGIGAVQWAPCTTQGPLQLWGLDPDAFMKDDNIKETIWTASPTMQELAFGSALTQVQMAEKMKNLTITYFLTSEKVATAVWGKAVDVSLSASQWVRSSPGGNRPTRVYYWEEKIKSSEVLLLAVCNTITIVYVYMTFSKLHQLGSKYVLGVASLLSMSGALLVTIGIFHFLALPLTLVVSEVTPFLYILIGLDNTYTLSKYVTRRYLRHVSDHQAGVADGPELDVSDFIGRGLAVCGPNIMVDSLFKLSVLLAGSLAGVKVLEQVSVFAAVSLLVEVILFLTLCVPVVALKVEHSMLLMLQPKRLRKKVGCKELTGSLQHLYMYLQQQTEAEDPQEQPQIDRGKLWAVLLLLCLSLMAPALHHNAGTSGAAQPIPSLLAGQPGLSSYQSMIVGEARVVQLCESADECGKSAMTVVHHCRDLLGADPCSVLEGSALGAMDAEQCLVLYVVALSAIVIIKYVFMDTPTVAVPSATPSPHKCSPVTTRKGPLKAVSNAVTDDGHTAPPSLRRGERPKFTIDGSESPMPSPHGSLNDIQLLDKATGSAPAEDMAEETQRTAEECDVIVKQGNGSTLSDGELMHLLRSGMLPSYKVEKACSDNCRGIRLRRQLVAEEIAANGIKDFNATAMMLLPYLHMDYSNVLGVCCENVLGYIPVPVGFAGPLLLNGAMATIPMATTEGALIASTHRGCKAITQSGGATCTIIGEGMTRAPVVRLPSAERCVEVKKWLENADNYTVIKDAFESTSRFTKLQHISCRIAGRLLYMRFVTLTGDAMGMNMISKATERALSAISLVFLDLEVLALSGNYCTDKKSAAVNWVEGRGKSVVAEAVIRGDLVQKVLKTTVEAMVEVNIAKNLVGSAMAGSLGGFNAHAANVVTAIFIACGQDPAQNVESSTCITVMETINHGRDLYISCTMPSIEVGTVGGGTQLPAQATCLRMLGVQGPNRECPGENARKLAQAVAGAVMGGELSLMAALASGHLVRSHMAHNRSQLNLASAAEIAEKERKFIKLQEQLSSSTLSLQAGQTAL